MSESAIGTLEERLAKHLQRRDTLTRHYSEALREENLNIENIQRAIARHVAALHNSHVVEPDAAVLQ